MCTVNSPQPPPQKKEKEKQKKKKKRISVNLFIFVLCKIKPAGTDTQCRSVQNLMGNIASLSPLVFFGNKAYIMNTVPPGISRAGNTCSMMLWARESVFLKKTQGSNVIRGKSFFKTDRRVELMYALL